MPKLVNKVSLRLYLKQILVKKIRSDGILTWRVLVVLLAFEMSLIYLLVGVFALPPDSSFYLLWRCMAVKHWFWRRASAARFLIGLISLSLIGPQFFLLMMSICGLPILLVLVMQQPAERPYEWVLCR